MILKADQLIVSYATNIKVTDACNYSNSLSLLSAERRRWENKSTCLLFKVFGIRQPQIETSSLRWRLLNLRQNAATNYGCKRLQCPYSERKAVLTYIFKRKKVKTATMDLLKSSIISSVSLSDMQRHPEIMSCATCSSDNKTEKKDPKWSAGEIQYQRRQRKQLAVKTEAKWSPQFKNYQHQKWKTWCNIVVDTTVSQLESNQQNDNIIQLQYFIGCFN